MTAKHPEMMVGAGTVLTVEQVDEAVAAVGPLAKIGVDCSHIVRGGDRLGIYFLENGASVRPSSVIYDRANSAIKHTIPGDINYITEDEVLSLMGSDESGCVQR